MLWVWCLGKCFGLGFEKENNWVLRLRPIFFSGFSYSRTVCLLWVSDIWAKSFNLHNTHQKSNCQTLFLYSEMQKNWQTILGQKFRRVQKLRLTPIEVEPLPAVFPPQAGIELSWFPSGSMTNLTTPLPSELKRHLPSSCEPGSFMFRTEALRPSLPSSHPSRIALAFSPCALIISCVWELSVGEELSGFVGFLVCNGLAPLHYPGHVWCQRNSSLFFILLHASMPQSFLFVCGLCYGRNAFRTYSIFLLTYIDWLSGIVEAARTGNQNRSCVSCVTFSQMDNLLL